MCRQLISCNAAVVGVADVSQLHSFVSAFVSPFARFLFFRLPCEFTAVYTLDCCHTFMTSVAATGGQRRAASVVIKCATCLQHTCRQHCTRTHAESKERSQVIQAKMAHEFTDCQKRSIASQFGSDHNAYHIYIALNICGNILWRINTKSRLKTLKYAHVCAAKLCNNF